MLACEIQGVWVVDQHLHNYLLQIITTCSEKRCSYLMAEISFSASWRVVSLHKTVVVSLDSYQSETLSSTHICLLKRFVFPSMRLFSSVFRGLGGKQSFDDLKIGGFLTFTAHFISFKFESCSAFAVKASSRIVTNVFTSRVIQATFIEIWKKRDKIVSKVED